MTTVNKDDLANSISGFPPQASRFLSNPSTRTIFTAIIIILKVYPVLVLILGSFGNILSFCVLLRKNMRRYSTFCYLACLALVDIGVIITFCINFIGLYHFDYDLQSQRFACKLYAFSIYFLPQYSSWILVAVSIDRVISAKYLRLAKTWSKPRHSVLVTVVLGLILGILNSHFFLYVNNSIKPRDQQPLSQTNRSTYDQYLLTETFFQQTPDEFAIINSLSNAAASASGSSVAYGAFTPPSSIQSIYRDTTLEQQYETHLPSQQDVDPLFDVNNIYCSLESSTKHAFLHVFWIWFDLLMNVFLPFTAMIACTIIIILTLVRSSTRAGSTSARRSRRRRNISVMLITVNLVFISLTAPIVIFLSVYQYVKDEKDDYRHIILILIKIFCIVLMNLNHSVNIIIYSATAKEFRTEMANFLHAVLYCIIGKPTNPNDFSRVHGDQTVFSRLRNTLLGICRLKRRSNSTNITDSAILQHTTAPGTSSRLSKTDKRLGKKLNPRKVADHNGKTRSSCVRHSETSAVHRNSHRLTVQLPTDGPSSVLDREDVSLHRLSNSTED